MPGHRRMRIVSVKCDRSITKSEFSCGFKFEVISYQDRKVEHCPFCGDKASEVE